MGVRRLFGSALAGGLVAAAGAVVSVAGPAAAQNVMVTSTVREDSGAPAGMISGKGVEKYGSLLGLDDDQKAAFKSLHEGYVTEYQAAAKEMRDGMQELTRAFEDTQDHSVFSEKMPAIRRTHREKTKKLEAGLLADLKALLSPAQDAGWPKVERQRRRETSLRGSFSGESVNILQIVEGLKVQPDAPLSEALNDYELELDRALAAKEQAQPSGDSFGPGGGQFNMEEFQERMAKAREAGLKVREVNQRHARRVEPLLPEAKRWEFAAAVRRDSFPRVYRPSRTSRALEESLKFTDLDAPQREAISALKTSYDRDLAAVNDRWASAIEDDEKSDKGGGTMMMPGGGVMQVRMGDEDKNSPLAQARKARTDLDSRTRERLHSQLRPDQKEKLPKGPDRDAAGEDGAFEAVGGMGIFVVEDDQGGGGR
ncbi:MAG: hypothetical protein ACKVU4_09865 [Phycisphaerales bacterium]